MTIPIEMPQLSSEDEGATLATWLVAVGDRVEQGDVIAELETDKSTVELEAPETGVVLELVIEEGVEGITPGTVLAIIEGGAPGAAVKPAAIREADSGSARAEKVSVPDEATESEGSDEPVEAANQSPSASEFESTESDLSLRHSTPLARRAAVERDVDLSRLDGSGPGGRVVEGDVLRSAGKSASGRESGSRVEPISARSPVVEDVVGPFQSIRLSAMRKTIARRMTESKQQVPHFYLRIRCSMDAVLDIRARLNQDLAEEGRGVKISVNDFILRAAGLALREVPEANVSFAGNEMHIFDQVDIAVAVATDGGLVTPVVRNADRKGLAALASQVKELALLARAGKLRPDQYQGGTFTISNLGMYGIDTVYPIINPPQACILGVGAAAEEPVVRHGKVEVGRVASLTLAADHRAVDGAVAAQFLAALRERLEDPIRLML